MTDEMTCRICGGDIALNRYPALKTHQSLGTCIKILRTRAEAAEDDLRELRENTLLALGVKPADVADDMADGSIRYILGGLLGRLAELEAAARWQYWPNGRRQASITIIDVDAKENEMINKFKNMLEGAIALTRDHQTNAAAAQCAQIVAMYAQIVAMYAQVIARAEAAEDDLRELRENTLRALGVKPADVADDEALEAPPGDMAQKENEMIDEQEAKQRRLMERIADLEGFEEEVGILRETEVGRLYQTIEELKRSYDAALDREFDALKRLAALRQFARWRPVSEKPVDDKPVLALMESGEYKVVRYVDKVGGVTLRYWRGTGGPDEHVAHWRPIIHHIKGE